MPRVNATAATAAVLQRPGGNVSCRLGSANYDWEPWIPRLYSGHDAYEATCLLESFYDLMTCFARYENDDFYLYLPLYSFSIHKTTFLSLFDFMW